MTLDQVPPSGVLTLSHVTLRAACKELAAIAAKPTKDGNDSHVEFPFGGFAIGEGHGEPVHRCLSAPEARAKLTAIQRLTGRALGNHLTGWEQLSATTLLALETIVLSHDPQERRQGVVGQPEDWSRLDELLFSRWFSRWLSSGANFAPAPSPTMVARRLSISMDAYKLGMKRLRRELARPTHEDCQPRVDHWLGDPPRDEAGAHAPRLWVSARAHQWPTAEAAKSGLLPANTDSQVQEARAAIYQRWVARDDDALDQSADDELPLQLTQCRRCKKWLDLSGLFGC